ncbi:hypothetical protein OG948_41575 (plasmid) [Embleya sp. NBC_00888]|uniref:hypothetical protein n=1 Tax=Embleya sp. NBC_00888 TaxID=2975960 RepID=UPI002F906F6E|nr:hypothetical protein OG948_41575 [Embleya sp. NBC_00888]
MGGDAWDDLPVDAVPALTSASLRLVFPTGKGKVELGLSLAGTALEREWQVGVASACDPECAGGPPLTRIALEDAAATADVLTLAVNLTPNPDTVTPPGNYAITPAVTVTEARIDANSPFHILVTAEFKVDHEYQVTVHGLESEIGTGVDPEHDTLRFTPRAPAIEG